MLRRSVTTLVLSASTLLAAAAAAAAPALSSGGRAAVVEARRALQDAADKGMAEGILAARGGLVVLSPADQATPEVHYALAVQDWWLVPLLLSSDDKKAQAAKYVDDALAHAKALQTLTPKDGEGWALEASFLGFKTMSPDADIMTLGRQMLAGMERAVKLSPTNPRVWLLRGINTFYTPPAFGGGPDRAIPMLAKAAELAAAETPADDRA